MSHWHTQKATNIKQTKETDGQADGERQRTDKSHGAGVHLFMEIHSMGTATEHRGVTRECSPAMTAGTRCQRDPARAALQHQLDRLNLHQRDPASTVRGCLSCGPCTRYVWATVLSAVEVLFLPYPGLGLRRKHSAPTQSSIPPELEQHH